jgi:DNA-binding transcriptional LysR family regulator
MELTDLRYFANVALARSFSAGAKQSHVSPPAVSKTIAKLESELGTALFVRTTRRVVLTEAGEILLRRSRRIFDELDGLRQELDETSTAVRGDLRVGAMEVFSIRLLPAAIAHLTSEHPGIVPATHEVMPQLMERLLVEGRLDVGFTIGASGSHKDIDYQTIGISPGVLVCGKSHPLYKKARVVREDLHRFPSVVPRMLDFEHLPVLDQFPEERFPRSVGATIELLQMGVQLAIDGAYLGFFPEICVRDHLEQNRLRALRGIRFGVSFQLQALTRAGAPAKRATRLLIDVVKRATKI